MQITKKQFLSIYKKTNELGWEIDRMSSGGVQVYNQLMDELDEVAKSWRNGQK